MQIRGQSPEREINAQDFCIEQYKVDLLRTHTIPLECHGC
jgi:hypothetical protein